MKKYPKWAPQILVDEYKLRTTKTAYERRIHDYDPDQIADNLVASESYQAMKAGYLEKGMSADTSTEIEEKIRAKLNLETRSLPERISTPILHKLITDSRMRTAWAAIKKRTKEEEEFSEFWKTCEDGILGWKKDQKLSRKQHMDYCIRISKLAEELSELMEKDKYFYNFSAGKLIQRKTIQELFKMLDLPPSGFKDENVWIDHAHHLVSAAIPRLSPILTLLSIEAVELLANEQQVVKKPKSDNAHVHYFIRTLSKYCKKKYGQPLHEVVATTAVVILDDEDISFDYVQKLVR